MTRIVMTLLVRNEEDIVEANIEYHLSRGVDFIIATDNGSQDATRDLLRKYERTGYLHLIDEPSDDYSQWKWVTRMARMAFSVYNAKWVINNDADEFWWPLSGDLKFVLENVNATFSGLRVQRSNFYSMPENGRSFYERMHFRERRSLNHLGKTLPPKTCHRGEPHITVEQGNHSISGCEGPIVDTEKLVIFHFPMRSLDQFVKKIQMGGAAYSRNIELDPQIGSVWRNLYELYLKGCLPDWYSEQVLSLENATLGLASGEIIEDTRLRNYMRDLSERKGATGLWSETPSSQSSGKFE